MRMIREGKTVPKRTKEYATLNAIKSDWGETEKPSEATTGTKMDATKMQPTQAMTADLGKLNDSNENEY